MVLIEIERFKGLNLYYEGLIRAMKLNIEHAMHGNFQPSTKICCLKFDVRLDRDKTRMSIPCLQPKNETKLVNQIKAKGRVRNRFEPLDQF